MKEEWKDIKGFEGSYQISNMGRVRSLDRDVVNSKGCINHIKGKLLSSRFNNNGYRIISLQKDSKRKTYLVHRLVAIAFIPNPNNFRVINHKDENKSNNVVSNLEWCTDKYNLEYSGNIVKCADTNKRKVRCITTNIVFDSIREASIYAGLKCHSSLSACCLGKHKYAGKLIDGTKLKWEYID